MINQDFQLISALLFLQGEKGLNVQQLKLTNNLSTSIAKDLLKKFETFFNQQNLGFKVIAYNDVYRFVTINELHLQISKLYTQEKKQKLSNAALEVVGIIAYKQPITKNQINQLRGIASESIVNTLLLKGLIEEKGIDKTIGNPILYGVSDKFYDYFALNSLQELPNLSEFDYSEGVDEEFDLFSSQRE